MGTWSRAVATAAAISCCDLLCAATVTAEPPDFDLSHHPVPALGPGVGIGIYDGNDQPGVLTAGHCDRDGAATYFNAVKGFQVVGYFNHRAYAGDDAGDDDIAVLGIGNDTHAPPVSTDNRIIGIRPITAPVDDAHLANGQQLCHYGLTSGSRHRGPECGPIVGVQTNTVRFQTPVEKGDSGGPVYYRNADGTATPVGITIRAGSEGGTVAELIGPWLKRWRLRLDGS